MLQFVAAFSIYNWLLCMVELILKLPANKPPFLGVLYTNIYQASNENKMLVEDKLTGFEIVLIPAGDKMHLKLKCTDRNLTLWYKDLSYDKTKFDIWIRHTTAQVNFGHIMQEFDKHVIVKTPAKQIPFVLKIDKVYMESEY